MNRILLKSFFSLLISITFFINTVSAQADCGNTFGPITNATGQTTLCDDGSDAVTFTYNAADNLSSPNLPNFAYVFESPAGLSYLETGSVTIDPTDSIFAAMVANPLLCALSGLDAATCSIISNLNAQGGIASISEAVDFGVNLGLPAPATTTEAIALLVSADSTASPLGGICFAISNNGTGYDYCFDVESCCPVALNLTGAITTGTYQADDLITSNGQVTAASGGPVNYFAGDYIELTSGFEADGAVDFTAIIMGCN